VRVDLRAPGAAGSGMAHSTASTVATVAFTSSFTATTSDCDLPLHTMRDVDSHRSQPAGQLPFLTAVSAYAPYLSNQMRLIAEMPPAEAASNSAPA